MFTKCLKFYKVANLVRATESFLVYIQPTFSYHYLSGISHYYNTLQGNDVRFNEQGIRDIDQVRILQYQLNVEGNCLCYGERVIIIIRHNRANKISKVSALGERIMTIIL